MKTIINKLLILLIITSCGKNNENKQGKNKEFMFYKNTNIIIQDSTLFIVNKGTKFKISILENKILRLTTLDSLENENKFYTFDSSGMLGSGIIDNGYFNGKVNYYKNGIDLWQTNWYSQNKYFFGQITRNDGSLGANYKNFIEENIDTSELLPPIIKPYINNEEKNYIELQIPNFPIELTKYTVNFGIEKSEHNLYRNTHYLYFNDKHIGKIITIEIEYMNPDYKTIKTFENTLELK